MSRRRYGFNEKRIASFMAEGRGRGIGPNYRPWLTVADLPSQGRSHRTFCTKTQRAHHTLSDGEHYALHQLWWEDSVTDIREQYPLPRIETLSIAAKLKFRHPVDVASGAPLVQTTDFLVTRFVNGTSTLEAISVKQDDDLCRNRVLEKLEIERQYWLALGIAWRLLPHSEVKTVSTRNLVWILSGDPSLPGCPDAIRSGIFDRLFLDHLADFRSVPVRLVCSLFDDKYAQERGTALRIFRGLLARKAILTDLNQRNLQEQPCSAYREVMQP